MSKEYSEELKKSYDYGSFWRNESNKKDAEITKLTKYATHLQDCAVYTEGRDDAECSCGFSEVSK